MAGRRKRLIWRRKGLPQGYFHLINRGARKLSIFADDEDRSQFVRLLGRFALKYKVLVISWCLMPNHFHLEVLAAGAAMCRMMHDLQSAYALAYNKRHGTTGCMFQGRFRCVAIKTEEGLACVSRYIHANPRDLGIRAEEYLWSSCRSYLGQSRIPKWLHPELVLTVLRREDVSDIEAYRQYLAAVPPKKRSNGNKTDELEDMDIERVRRLEEKLSERWSVLGSKLGRVSLQTLVCWSGREIHGIRADVLARYFGYASAQSVYSIVHRFGHRAEDFPDLDGTLAFDLF
ncbi:MAG TPA: transposase [Nitrospirales bacterium]|nr:transposase [Nitrospirales bacterium]